MILYKYCPPARVDVLVNHKIRFTPPRGFNDPFEFRPVLKAIASDAEIQSYTDRAADNLIGAELQKYGPMLRSMPSECVTNLRATVRSQMLSAFRSADVQEIIQKLKSEFDAKFNEYFGVLCLSEQWDSILMWGHYSQSHEGFAIGFDSDHPFFNQRRSKNDEFGYLRPVRYRKERPLVSLMNSGGLEWFDTKADVWTYENERRMFLVLSSASEVLTVAGIPIHLFKFPSDCVKEVLLGSKCTEQTEHTIREALTAHGSKPALWRCDIDDTDYRIVRKPLAGID